MSRIWSTVVLTAFATVAVVEGIHYLLSKDTDHTNPKKTASKLPVTEYPEELIEEQLARNYAFLGKEGCDKFRNQNIVVVGAGGVGSWTATMLVRSGVGKIRIIDFDQVTLSSLNRHAVANLQDVGTSKVECLKTHLEKIAPWVVVEARNQLWTKESAEELIFGDEFKPSYIVDCIDNIDTKVDLLAFCYENKLPVVSSGGAACKSDPSRINIGDISKTEEDPLSRNVRIRLKKKGIITNIPTVFSAEKPDPRKAQILPLSADEVAKGKVDELSALKNFRVRILPVLGTMPGMYGLTIATFIITKVAGYPMEPIEGKNRYKIYDGIFSSLAGQQTRLGHLDQKVPISLTDVNYILEEVWRGKSPISNYSTKLTLSRWDPSKEISTQNVVVMTKDEQSKHEKRVLLGDEKIQDAYSKEVLELIEKRFADDRYWSQFRQASV